MVRAHRQPAQFVLALAMLLAGFWLSRPAAANTPDLPQPAEPAPTIIAGEPNFELDVLPVLTATGCNAGACHGKARGQNGFALSLLGFDAAFDYSSIVEQAHGRQPVGRRLGLPASVLQALPQSVDVAGDFQIDAAGNITSPRVPVGDEKSRAVPGILSVADWNRSKQLCAEIGERLHPREILAALPEANPATSCQMSAAEPLVQAGRGNRQIPAQADANQQAEPNAPPQGQIAMQQELSSNEYRARSQVFSQNAAFPNYMNRPSAMAPSEDGNAAAMTPRLAMKPVE